MKELKFEFTIEETNIILEALGGQPFKQVFGLINKIQQQAASQLNGQADQLGNQPKADAETPKIHKSN